MYTDAKVDGHPIKLILDSSSADSIITRQLMDQLVTKTPIGEIDDFLFEVNGIITPIKVLVIEASQYQALVGNDWLFKTNAVLNWMMQELQLSVNGQHTCVPATCGHFKVSSKEEPLIELKEEKKPIWKAFQVFWANADHNELSLILSWNDKGKKKKEELIWQPNLRAWDEDELNESTAEWTWEEKRKGKEKKDDQPPSANSAYVLYSMPPQTGYFVVKNCQQWAHAVVRTKNRQQQLNTTVTHDSTLCLTCGDTLLDEGMWKDIPGRGGAYNETCQYTILINNWVRKGTPINDAWKQTLKCLKGYPHDKDEI
ncbi:hypothetical protein G9A89_021444 [Geosiphon pyriformis]|nr:hypothetical protein G9A89_021444 [Geosiphon pyriformis]